MHTDISHLLGNWRHDDSVGVQARLITGRDGTARVQLRLELGVLQMELHGRPDGSQPHGFESLLDYHQYRVRRHQERRGTIAGFALSHEECLALHRESYQYYHRRLSLLEIGLYDLAEQDADHNLQVLDLLRDHAARREDWLTSEQYRAFILSHRTMARAMAHSYDGKLKAALLAVDEGIEEISRVLREHGGDPPGGCPEIEFLHQLKRRIRRGKPGALRERLERELEQALQHEEYERAAVLRDQLRDMP